MPTSRQIPLVLEPRRDARLEDFVPGPNGAVVEALRVLVGDHGGALFLHGAPGTGKTHLLNAACQAAREQGLTAVYLALDRLPEDAMEALQGLEAMDLVALDDLQAVAGDPGWEEALFHFINRLRAAHGRLLVASERRLRALALGLPDLASRLAWGLRLELQALDDESKAEVLRRHARAHGVSLPEEVIAYLIRRSDRSLPRLLVLVDRLRERAFTDKRPITVPLARTVLDPS